MPRLPPVALPVPEHTLLALGWGSLRASATPDPDLLAPLLAALAAEPCAHSWRTWLVGAEGLAPVARLDRVLRREQALRPTEVWTYVAETAAGPRAVAVAGIAERPRADFPHDGFPVLARAFVLPEARGHGLHPLLVRHRLERCRLRWAEDLLAVHVGAGDPAVEETLRRDDLPLRFVHVGDEVLQVAGGAHVVRDFVAFAPAFLRILPAAPPALAAFVAGGAAAVPWSRLRPLLVGHPSPAPRMLMALLDCIGVRA